jgi:type VI protein secretion system component VasF
MADKQRAYPVWVYIGGVLLVYGVLLVGGGVFQLWHAPQTVLAQYHATLWAGLVLPVVGALYLAIYGPWER